MGEPVPAPIVRVDLFADRARVTRRLIVERAGRQVVVVGPITPLVRQGEIRCATVAPIVVEELRVERRPQRIAPRDDTAQAAAAERASAALDELRRATERAGRSELALSAARAASARALLDSSDPVARWIEALADLAQRHGELLTAEARARRTADRLQDAVENEPTADGPPDGRLEGWLTLALFAESGGEITLEYEVPCAAWRPCHRAAIRGRGAERRLRWESRGVCWNATGEDWDDAEIVCSTAAPAEPPHAPVLVDDLLASRLRPQADQDVDPLLHIAREPPVAWVDEAAAVDDRGVPVHLVAKGRSTIPSDGRPVTLPLETWEGTARVGWVALPERSAHAVLRATQKNASGGPLLAGPVELVRDGTFIGRTRIGYVAPDETFHVGFGAHPAVHVSRRREQHVDRPTLSGPQRHAFTVEVRIALLGDEPCDLEVRERIPTSELDEISVTARGGPTGEPTADGFWRWRLRLAPGDVRSVGLDYAIDAEGHVRLPF